MKKSLLLGATVFGIAGLAASPTINIYADSLCSVENTEGGLYSDLATAVTEAESGDNLIVTGTCALSDTIKLEKALKIVGGDDDATITYNAGSDDYKHVFWFGDNSGGSLIENLIIHFNGTGNEVSAFYFGYENNGGTAENPTTINNNTIVGDTGNYAIGISTTYNLNTKYVDITDNWIKDFRYGIYLNGVTHFNIVDNGIINTAYNGINIAGDNPSYECSDILIDDNALVGISSVGYDYAQYSAGIRVGEYASNITITNNDIAMLNNKLPIFVESTAATIVTKDNIINSSDDDSEIPVLVEGLEALNNANYSLTPADLTVEEVATIKSQISNIYSGAVFTEYGVLDISLYRTLSDGITTEAITDTSGNPITFTLAMPEGINPVADGYSRTFRVARIHDGVISFLDATVSENGKFFSFTSDLFSEFVLFYTDTQNVVTSSSPNTGYATASESASAVATIAPFAAIVAAAVLLFAGKKLLKKQ